MALDNPAFSVQQRLPPDADANDPATFARYAVGREYAPDRIAGASRDWVRANRDRPFFLFYAATAPHLALQVPADSLSEYAGAFPEVPYRGERGYLPHPTPRAAYAAMVSRLDRDVGRLLDQLRELGLEQNTLVVFTSDNGPAEQGVGGTDSAFFDSAGGLRGRKGSFHEGGFRVPCLVRWPGRVAPGTVSGRVGGFEDWLPTLLEAAGAPAEPGADGVSLVPSLCGRDQPVRPPLYRESPGYGRQQCLIDGDWKLVRRDLKAKAIAELFDLGADPAESIDRSKDRSGVLDRLSKLAAAARVPSTRFPLRGLDGGPAQPR